MAIDVRPLTTVGNIVLRMIVLTAGALLAGCGSTTFESVPITETSCDAGIVGDWDWKSNGTSASSTFIGIDVDPDCQHVKVVLQLDTTQKPTSVVVSLHNGHEGGWNYAWIDISSLNTTNDPEMSKFSLVRYRVDKSGIDVYLPDDKAIANSIFDGTLFGTSHFHNGRKFITVHNQIDQGLDMHTFDRRIVFLSTPWRFERRNENPSR